MKIKAEIKPYIPTDKEQKVAVDFLENLIALRYFRQVPPGEVPKTLEEELDDFINFMTEKYKVEEDPFTRFPCTTKEYLANREEYEAQCFEEKWGYRE